MRLFVTVTHGRNRTAMEAVISAFYIPPPSIGPESGHTFDERRQGCAFAICCCMRDPNIDAETRYWLCRLFINLFVEPPASSASFHTTALRRQSELEGGVQREVCGGGCVRVRMLALHAHTNTRTQCSTLCGEATMILHARLRCHPGWSQS